MLQLSGKVMNVFTQEGGKGKDLAQNMPNGTKYS